MFKFSSLEQVMVAGNHFKNRARKVGKTIFDPKKGLLLALCIIAINCTCFGQDIIVTKDARRINAKVTEVNVDNVRYKNFDNQDGPIYTLLKSDIASIVYQNGQVETFVSGTTSTAGTQIPTGNNSGANKGLSELLVDMEAYRPILYQQYQSGKKMTKTGWILSGVGTGVSLIGYGLYMGLSDNWEEDGARAGGSVIIVAGSVCLAAGIPILIVGESKKKRALRDFSKQYYSSSLSIPRFQLNVYPHRIGLAYVF